MRNSLFAVFFVLLSGCLIAQETAMDPEEVDSFRERVIAESRAITTLTSDFTQYKHLDFLAHDVKTSGKMAFKTPNLVKWEYTDPYHYSVVFKKDQMLINDGGTKSKVDIGNSELFTKLNQFIVNSVKGDMFNDTDFSVSFFSTPDHNKAVFIPKDKNIAEYIASFVLLFNKDTHQVQEVKMVEPSEDYTQIIFNNRIINKQVNDAVFSN